MALYRLKQGTHHVPGRGDLAVGDTLELTSEQYAGLKDRFEPVMVDSTQPSGVGEKPGPKDASGANVSSPDDTEKFVKEVGANVQPIDSISSTNSDDVLGGTVGDAQDAIAKINSAEELDRLEKAEIDGKARKGVLDAIEARRSSLG